MFGVICETSVSVGRLVGRLGVKSSQPAAAAHAGWHGPLGDLCWSSPSSAPPQRGAAAEQRPELEFPAQADRASRSINCFWAPRPFRPPPLCQQAGRRGLRPS